MAEPMGEETFRFILQKFLFIEVFGEIEELRLKLAINPFAKYFYWLVAGIQL
eukprot:CAMPEP_0196996302 /NCGR_PEP_ID=MMETSP1380-20130617/2226_1 /TAXON_ID=5936 /ORGANISM="Euplotes crassus, Strain CT5" /LENGTH=51 /DNA_ID=CAMNT_0042412223 /DNA_START=70 /DNA_END=225 /DNA_ORIENTATION=-